MPDFCYPKSIETGQSFYTVQSTDVGDDLAYKRMVQISKSILGSRYEPIKESEYVDQLGGANWNTFTFVKEKVPGWIEVCVPLVTQLKAGTVVKVPLDWEPKWPEPPPKFVLPSNVEFGQQQHRAVPFDKGSEQSDSSARVDLDRMREALAGPEDDQGPPQEDQQPESSTLVVVGAVALAIFGTWLMMRK